MLAPHFYGVYAINGRYVTIDKGRLAHVLQRRFAVDTIVQGSNGSAICIEEKIVRWPGYHYQSFCLETNSCTVPGHESDGWMVYGKADYLLYCFQLEDGGLDCWLIDFAKLQEWFWPLKEMFPTFLMSETLNKTCGRLVPIEDVRTNVPTWRRLVKQRKETTNGPANAVDF